MPKSLPLSIFLSFISQVCSKYLLKLASVIENIWRNLVCIESTLGAWIGSSLEVICMVVYFEFLLLDLE
jgi:hypothetical protein